MHAKQMTLKTMVAVVLTAAILAGCSLQSNLPATITVPTTASTTEVNSEPITAPTVDLQPTLDMVKTQAARTVVAELTLNAPTATPVTPTSTPTATATATQAETPTQEPLNVAHKMVEGKVDVETLPLITLEDITSGRLATTERLLLANGTVAGFSKDAFLGTLEYTYIDYRGYGDVSLNNTGDYQKYITNKDLRPVKGVSASRLTLDGENILVVGLQWLNGDGTTGLVHVGLQNWRDSVKRDWLAGIFNADKRPIIVSRIDNPSYQAKSAVFEVNFNYEDKLVSIYENESPERDALCQQWAINRIIPVDLERKLMVPIFASWR